MDEPVSSLPQAGFAPGDRIGAYRVLSPLGEGGEAVVYRALHLDTGREVALKTARAHHEGLIASVRSETRALERLDHPGVIKIIEGGIQDGLAWYAMELLQGATLRRVLRSQRSLAGSKQPYGSSPISETRFIPNPGLALSSNDADNPATPHADRLTWFLTLMRRVCEPLAYIHGEGLVHRDLTPSNIFVRADGLPVLMDFGLVWRLIEGGSREVFSIDRVLAGTVAYMAPEQALGERLDPRADLFSLGCIMYEGITGRPPFPGESWSQLIAAHRARAPDAPSKLTEGIPAALDRLVMSLLQVQPRDRIGHARDVAAALADLGADEWPEVIRPEPKAYLYRPRLVGRKPALTTAFQHVHALRQGRGGCMLVRGESGIGKTSFVSEIARLSELEGIRVVSGQCSALGMIGDKGIRRGGPLYPWSGFLLAVADRCVAGGADVAAALLGPNAKILALVEPSLLRLPGVQHASEPAEVPGEAARRRLIDALSDTISAFVSDQPTLLVLEDLQWADDVTLAFLAMRSEQDYANQSLLVLGTYRSEEETRELAQLARTDKVALLQLASLDPREIGAMAAEMLGQQQVNTSLAASLSAVSSGNPFFAAEYLRAAVDANSLYRDERGRWQSNSGTPLDELDLPHTLGALVTRRLEHLNDGARHAIEVASVLGRDFEIELLQDLLGRAQGAPSPGTELEENLRELVVHQVLESTSTGRMRFLHDKLREVTYDGLSVSVRRQLHGVCGLLLESRLPMSSARGPELSTLAHHFEQAGEVAKATRYYDRAGELAHALHANRESSNLLNRALQLEASLVAIQRSVPAVRARRWRLLGLNALAQGDVNQAFVALIQATKVSGKPWPSSRLAMWRRCAVAPIELIYHRLRTRLRAVELTADQRELLLEAARAYERLLVVNYFTTGDQMGVMLAAFTNVAFAERAGGASAERALGYAALAAMFGFLQLDHVAQSYCKRAEDVGRESGDDVARSWVLMNVAMVHLQAGRWPQMHACLEQVSAMSSAMKFNRRWEECLTQYSTGTLLHGNLREAERLNNLLSGAVERADPQSKCWAVVRRAELALLAGETALARTCAEQGKEFCRQNLARSEWVYALGALLLAQWRGGEHAAALETADACVRWIQTGSAPVFYHVFAYAALVEVRFEAWLVLPNLERARAARRAIKLLASLANAIAVARPRLALWRGFEALYLDGKKVRAARLFGRSAELAKELDMPYDEALALAALGRNHFDGDRKAMAHLERAVAIFDSLGARHDTERCRSWLSDRAIPNS